jgi:hypothetical protein
MPPTTHRVLHEVTITTAKNIFLMSQDTIHLKRPTEVEFANMWDAMNMMVKPLVIKGSTEADNQLVEIIRKKLRAEQLHCTSNHPFCQFACTPPPSLKNSSSYYVLTTTAVGFDPDNKRPLKVCQHCEMITCDAS